MGLDTDFYTSRRYTSSRPIVSSYTVSKRDIPWEKLPFVPRPTLIADPITAFGKRKPKHELPKPSILEPANRAAIRPSAKVLAQPIKPYISTRDKNREKVLSMVRHHIGTVESGGNIAAGTAKDSLDIILPRLHRTSQEKSPHRQTFFYEPLKYVY